MCNVPYGSTSRQQAMPNPLALLVSGTNGIGTKPRVAVYAGFRYCPCFTLSHRRWYWTRLFAQIIDLVAMSVIDLLRGRLGAGVLPRLYCLRRHPRCRHGQRQRVGLPASELCAHQRRDRGDAWGVPVRCATAGDYDFAGPSLALRNSGPATPLERMNTYDTARGADRK